MKNKMDSYVLLGLFTVISVVLALPFAPMRQAPDVFLKKYMERGAVSVGLDLNGGSYATSGIAIYDASGLPRLTYSAIAGRVAGRSYSYGTNLRNAAGGNYTVSHKFSEPSGQGVTMGAVAQPSVAGTTQSVGSSTPSGALAPGLRRVVVSSADSVQTDANTESTKDKNSTTTIVRQRDRQLGSLPLSSEGILFFFLLPLLLFKIHKIRID